MGIDRGDPRFRPMAGWKSLIKSRPLALNRFRKLNFISAKDRPFQYRVQVTTIDRRSQKPIYRTITISDDERRPISDVLQSAADAIMESPIAAREQFGQAEILSAARWRK